MTSTGEAAQGIVATTTPQESYRTWSEERRERERLALAAVRSFLHGMPWDGKGVPRETHMRRLEQRQRQIAIGKKTASYRFYAEHQPKETRPVGASMEECPRTPPPELKCSKRGFDAIVRRWRRALHGYCQRHPDAPLALREPRRKEEEKKKKEEEEETADDEPDDADVVNETEEEEYIRLRCAEPSALSPRRFLTTQCSA
jgi:hypothetical protein